MNINTTFDRYCGGEDDELYAAQKALIDFHNGVFNKSRALNWPTLVELEQDVLRAALRAGYRMALADMRASLSKQGV